MEKLCQNKKFLNLMHAITQHQQYLSTRAMTKLKLDNGKTISHPTIKRWFKTIKQHNGQYYSTTTNNTAYRTITSINNTPIRPNLKKINTYKGINLKTHKTEIIQQHIIKKEDLAEKNSKQIKTKNPFTLYNQFHNMYKRGKLQINKGKFTEQKIAKLHNHLTQQPKEKVNKLLSYILLDKMQTCKNSFEIWNSIKTKKDIWQQIKTREQKDSIAIKRIQETLRKQKNLQNEIVIPQLTKELTKIMLIISNPSNQELINLARAMQKNSVKITYFHGPTSIVSTETNIQGLTDIYNHCKNKKEYTIYLPVNEKEEKSEENKEGTSRTSKQDCIVAR